MTPADAFIRYRRAAQRARSRVFEHHLEDIAERTNPWLFGPRTIMQAIQTVENRGGAETVTWPEIMNFLAVARFDVLLDQSCRLEGLPTVEEWIQAGHPSAGGLQSQQETNDDKGGPSSHSPSPRPAPKPSD